MKLTIELQIPYSFVPGQEITMQIDTEKYQVHHNGKSKCNFY